MTMTGMVVGTPLYMSPEQFMGKKAGDEIDGRSDLYSLGVVLYQMVTARLPFEGDTLYSIMMQHIEGNVIPPDQLVPELNVPPALSKLILKSIEKSRESRFQTAEEFIAALECVLPESVATPGIDARQSNTSAANIPETRRSPTWDRLVTSAPLASDLSVPVPSPEPVIPQQPGFTPVPVDAVSTPPPLPKSAAQHLFLQQRTFKARNVVVLIGLCLALALIGGLGFLKYRSIQRLKIQDAVVQSLKNSPSPTVRTARISVSVSDAGEVILDGIVPSLADSNVAATLSAAVSGVTRVSNRLQVVPPANAPPVLHESESTDSLIDKGMASLDAGDYATAIDCFTRAASDPNNKSAKALLDTARRAQKTEEGLLKKRR